MLVCGGGGGGLPFNVYALNASVYQCPSIVFFSTCIHMPITNNNCRCSVFEWELTHGLVDRNRFF